MRIVSFFSHFARARGLVHLSALGTLLAGVAMSAQLAACGGSDDEGGDPGANTSSSSGSSGTPEPTPIPDGGGSTGPTLTISNARASLYLGQTGLLDGASIAPGLEAPVWTLVNAPPESASTTASIQAANTAQASFTPDLLGSYTLQISGTVAGVSQSVLVFLDALDAPVFGRESALTQSGAGYSTTTATHVRGAYGSRDRVVDCAGELDAGSSSTEIILLNTRFTASAADTWEAAPGEPSRIAYVTVDLSAVGSEASPPLELRIATSSSECGSAEAKTLDRVAATDAGLPGFIQAARFSPNGRRIAYQRDENGRSVLATIGADGSERRELSGYHSQPDSGLTVDAGPDRIDQRGQVSMRWRDDTHVGWISLPSNDGARPDWTLYEVEDSAGGAVQRIMHCTDPQIVGFDYLPDGTILAATRHTVAPDQIPMDLTVYRANAGECEVVRRLTMHTRSAQVARDFALSPDKTQVAYFVGSGTGYAADSFGSGPSGLRLVTQPVDGSRPASSVPGAPLSGAVAGLGPRWIAGGTALTWGQQNIGMAGGTDLGKIMSIPVAGGEARTVVAGDVSSGVDVDGGTVVQYRLTYGIGQGCSAIPGSAPVGILAVFGVGACVAAALRRRRPRP